MAIKTDFVAGSQDAAGNVDALNGNFSELKNEPILEGVYNKKAIMTPLRKTPTIHIFGDSISEDPNGYVVMGGGDRWGDYVANQIDRIAGQKNYRGVNFRAGAESFDGWDRIASGVNLLTWKSKPTSVGMRLYFDNPMFANMEFKVIVITNPDGGGFTIRKQTRTGEILATGTSNGVAGGVTEVSFTSNFSQNYYIVPDSTSVPVYVYGWYATRVGTVQKSNGAVYNSSLGGRKLTDFSDEDLQKTVNAFPHVDTFIMALGANDITSLVPWNTFLQKLNVFDSAVEAYNSTAKKVILFQSRAQIGETTQAYIDMYNLYKQNLIEYADTNGYCLIDMDRVLGGYTKANANGLLLDTVHPNAVGHYVIGNFVSRVLLGESETTPYPSREGLQNGKIINNITETISNKEVIKNSLQQTYYDAGWILRTVNPLGHACPKAQFPWRDVDVYVGMPIYATDESKLYICTSESPVTWKSVALV